MELFEVQQYCSSTKNFVDSRTLKFITIEGVRIYNI